MLRNGTLRPQRGRQHEANLALLQDVAGAVAHAGLQAGVGDGRETECRLVIDGGLTRVAHVELDMIPSLDGHEILLSHAVYTSRNVSSAPMLVSIHRTGHGTRLYALIRRVGAGKI